MLKNLATAAVAACSAVCVGTIGYLAIAEKPIPEALERIGSNLISGALALATGTAAAVGGAAIFDRNKGGEDDANS